MALVAGRRRGPQGGSLAQGFSLVGLIVTLTIVVTLSGVATIYYQSVVDDQQLAIAANELDEYSKAIRAYMLKTRRNLNPLELEPFDEVYAGAVGDIPDDGYTMDFLVDEGLYREINRDPWGHIYRLDPNAATVYSLGPDASDPSDDIIRPYSRGSGSQSGNPGENPIPEDDIPPVISGIQPVGVIRVKAPVVRASFYDHFGGTIDQTSVRMFLDQVDLAGDSGLTTDSAGQILYTTSDGFSEGTHTVVVQVADTNGNLARREWTFTVDTNPASVEIHQPVQGEALRGTFTSEVEASDDTLKKVTIRLDFGDVSDKFRGLSPPSDAVWNNAIPPSNGGGSRYYGVWGPINTTLPPPNGIPDGTHFFTLLAEDFSGRVISTQSQFLVDNTSPTIDLTLAVDPFSVPPQGPTTPQVLATSVAHFETRALDNIRVAEIRYWFRDVGDNLVGYRGTAPVTGPEIMVPVDWLGEPSNDWAALYNSADELASTTADRSAAGYIPLTLPEGEFRFEAWAVDLAGNESSRVSTTFVINLSAAGVTSLVFFDQPPGVNPTGPLNVASQTISGMEYSLWQGNPFSDGTFGPITVQTTGHLRYQLLRSEPNSDFVASIDDFTTSPASPGRDGSYSPNSGGVAEGDWTWSITGIPNTTGTQIVHNPAAGPYGDPAPGPFKYGGYSVHRDVIGPFGWQALDRRGGTPTPFPGGELEGRLKVEYGLSGQERTAYTTFWVDTEYPLIDASNAFTQEVQTPLPQNQDLASQGYVVTQLTQQSPPEIRFGGFLEDRLCGGTVTCDQSKARVVNLWGRRFPSGSELPLSDPTNWYVLWPNATSNPKSHIATFGAPASQAGNTPGNPMNLTSDNPADIDGSYVFQFKATDGAGHTTAWERNVLVNAVGPLVDFIRIENAFDPAPAQMVPAVSAVTTSTIQEPFLNLSISVTDEVDIERIEYRITKIGPVPPFGSTIIPVPPGNPTYPVNNILIFQDQLGSVFRPAPTSYRLEVWGVSQGKQGIIAETRLEFEFLTDLAIYAPNYNDGEEVAIRGDEQKQIADYLFSNVDNVQSIAIYDHSGKVSDSAGTGQSDIAAWMSNRASDSQTDVLVILDAADITMTDATVPGDFPVPWGPLKAFLTSSDSNVVVFSGAPTIGMQVHDGAAITHGGYDSTSDDKQVQRSWRDALGTREGGGGGDRIDGIHVAEVKSGNDVQVPSPRAQMLLPSLSVYSHDDLTPVGGGYLHSPRQTIYENSSDGAEWVQEDLFTVDREGGQRDLRRNQSEWGDSYNLGGQTAGANFVLRELGGGLFANFLSYGHQGLGFTDTDRKASIATAPVIEEFIEQYLVGRAKPDAIGAKVAFTARKANHEVEPALGSYNSNELDVFTWPFYEGNQDYFGVLTRLTDDATRGAAAVMDMTPDGGAYLVFAAEQDDADFDESFTSAIHGYLFRSDSSRISLYRNSVEDKRTNPTWGRLSEDGRKAVILGSGRQDGTAAVVLNANNASGTDPGGMVAWLHDLASTQGPGDALAITTNAAAGAEGTIRADISGDGTKVVLITDTKMHSVDSQATNGFQGSVAMPPGERSLVVYNVGSDSYSLVNDETPSAGGGGGAIPPSGACANFFDNVVPEEAVISSDGSVVVWVGTGSGGCLGDQSQILISRNISDTWHTGRITACPSGVSCENGTQGFHGLDIADVGGDVPQVIFSSRGNFRNLNVGGSIALPETAAGADPTSGGGGGTAPPNIEEDFEPQAGTILIEDDFSTTTYTGGTGWSGGWTEVDDDGLLATGAIQLGGNACSGTSALILNGAQGSPPSGPPPVVCGTNAICDDFEDYAIDDELDTLNGGQGWTGPYTMSDSGKANRTGVKNSGAQGMTGQYLLVFNYDDDRTWERPLDGTIIDGMTSPVLEFDFDSEDDGGTAFEVYVQFTDTPGSGHVTVATLAVSNAAGDRHVGPIDISDATHGYGGNPREFTIRAAGVNIDDAERYWIDNIMIYDAGGGGGGPAALDCSGTHACDDLEGAYPGGGNGWSGNWSENGASTHTNETASDCGYGTVHRTVGGGSTNSDFVRNLAQTPATGGLSAPYAVFRGKFHCASGTNCANKAMSFHENAGAGGWFDWGRLFEADGCRQVAVPIRPDTNNFVVRNAVDSDGNALVDWDAADYLEVDEMRVVDGMPTEGLVGWAFDEFNGNNCSNRLQCGVGNWSGDWTDEEDSDLGNGVWRVDPGGPSVTCMPDSFIGNNDGDAVPHDDKRMWRGIGDLSGYSGGQVTVSFSAWYRCGSNCGTEGYWLQVNPSGTGDGGFVDRIQIDDSNPVSQCNRYSYTLAAADLGSDVYLRFRGGNGNSDENDVRIDDVTVYIDQGPATLPTGPVGGGGAASCGSGLICDDFETGTWTDTGSGWTGSWNGSNSGFTSVQGGGSGCLSGNYMRILDISDSSGPTLREWKRSLDLSHFPTPIGDLSIRFSWQENVNDNTEDVALQVQSPTSGGWQNVATRNLGTGCFDVDVSLGHNDASEIRFYDHTSSFWGGSEGVRVDNIEIYDASPPPPPSTGPSPHITRMFTTAVTGGVVNYRREWTGLALPDTGYQLEATTDGGTSWTQLVQFDDPLAGACFTDTGVPLPDGADGIRFSAIGTGNTTGVDVLKVDFIEIEQPGSPYQGGTSEWAGDWTEVNDGEASQGSPTNGDPSAGVIQGGHVNPCDGSFGVRFEPVADYDPSDEVVLERNVNLAAFASPQMEWQRTIGSGWEGGSEIFEIQVDGEVVRRYQDLDNTEPSIVRSCETELGGFSSISPSALVRLVLGPSNTGNYETDDWIILDNIIIRDGGAICGSVICDDFEDGDGNSDNFDNGAGWTTDWNEAGDNGDDATGNAIIDNDSASDCQDGNYLRINERFDDDNIEYSRDWDTGLFAAFASPALVFNAQLDCPVGDCNERWQIEIKDNSDTWRRVFRYYQGNNIGTYPTNTMANDPEGCNEFIVPLPQTAKGIRIRHDGGGWDASPSSGPDFLYLDNLRVMEFPATCGTDMVCDDWESGKVDSGSGWSNNWNDDDNRTTQITPDGGNPCRDGKHLRFDDDFDDDRTIQRQVDFGVRNNFAGGDIIVSFWAETTNGDGLALENYNGSGWENTSYDFNPTSCQYFQYNISNFNSTNSNFEQIRFRSLTNVGGGRHRYLDNLRIFAYPSSSGGGGAGLHDEVGLYIWTGSFGGSGNQFFRVVDPQDAAAVNPRISPDGRTFVFETTADEIHGVMGFDSYDGDKDGRVVKQVFDFTEESTIAGSGNWSSGDRKIFRGRFQKMSNAIFGFSSVLQLVAPLSRQGSGLGGDLEFTPTAFMINRPWVLPVTGN